MQKFEAPKQKMVPPADPRSAHSPPPCAPQPPHPQKDLASHQQDYSHDPQKPLQIGFSNKEWILQSGTLLPATQGAVLVNPCFYSPIQYPYNFPTDSTLLQLHYIFYFTPSPPPLHPSLPPIRDSLPLLAPTCPEMVVRAGPRRRRSEKKERESARKNSESNIINQLFSYLNTPPKSSAIVDKAITRLGLPDADKIRSIFYNIVRVINFRRGRKYVNADHVLSYFLPQHCRADLGDVADQMEEEAGLSIQHFCSIFRVSTFHFLAEESVGAVLTSRRISGVSRREHLSRRRKVLSAMERMRVDQ